MHIRLFLSWLMRLKPLHVVDKCIVELADKQAFSGSVGSRRFQCLAVCLRGKCLLYTVQLQCYINDESLTF